MNEAWGIMCDVWIEVGHLVSALVRLNKGETVLRADVLDHIKSITTNLGLLAHLVDQNSP